MAEWAAESGDESVWTFLRGIGETCDWDMLERVYDADDLCIGQTYLLLAGRYGNPCHGHKRSVNVSVTSWRIPIRIR